MVQLEHQRPTASHLGSVDLSGEGSGAGRARDLELPVAHGRYRVVQSAIGEVLPEDFW